MRIISQDGLIDCLYDSLILRIEDTAIVTNAGGQYMVYMALYSTPVKARAAMKRLHDSYQRMDVSVFQFPQDDEI